MGDHQGVIFQHRGDIVSFHIPKNNRTAIKDAKDFMKAAKIVTTPGKEFVLISFLSTSPGGGIHEIELKLTPPKNQDWQPSLAQRCQSHKMKGGAFTVSVEPAPGVRGPPFPIIAPPLLHRGHLWAMDVGRSLRKESSRKLTFAPKRRKM